MAPTIARRLASWRRRLETRRPLEDLEIQIPGAARRYGIALPADPDAVLDEVAQAAGGDSQLHMPYWATPWASGLALAEVALERGASLYGRRVLELGCGLGITACAALEAGARLTVSDCFPETLAYCQLNALCNARRAPRPLLADWRHETGRAALVRHGPFAIVLAADVLYEPEDIQPLLELVPRLVLPGGQFWLAEPGRTTSKRFASTAAGAGWRADRVELERDWPAAAGRVRVTIHLYQL